MCAANDLCSSEGFFPIAGTGLAVGTGLATEDLQPWHLYRKREVLDCRTIQSSFGSATAGITIKNTGFIWLKSTKINFRAWHLYRKREVLDCRTIQSSFESATAGITMQASYGSKAQKSTSEHTHTLLTVLCYSNELSSHVGQFE